MKVSLKDQAVERKNSESCTVTEYTINNPVTDMAVVNITGRYPETGRVTNLICKEIVYIKDGRGKVVVDGKEQILETGDVVLIEPKEKYYWEGNLCLLISCTPAFTIEQHQKIQDENIVY